MKAQFFIISSVIMIYVIVLTFQYLTGFSDIRLSGVEEHQELSYIKNIKDSLTQTFNVSNYSSNGDLNKVAKDIDFAKNFFKQELLKKGIGFDSKFIIFSNGFETGDLSKWDGIGCTGVDFCPNAVNYAYDGSFSLYCDNVEYVYKKLSGMNEVYARVYVNFKTLPLNPYSHYFIDFYDDGNQILGLGLWNDAGAYKLRAYSNSINKNWSSVINIHENEWHFFELYWYENDTNSKIKAWYDGDLKIGQTDNSGGKGKSIDEYRFGGVDVGGGGIPDLHVDCAAISNDFIGEECYPDEEPYFVFNLKTKEMETKTKFSFEEYLERIINPLIWFKFNEANGTTAYDSSGNGYVGIFSGETFNDGKLGSGTAGTEPNRLSGSSCKYGNCLDFDGINDFVNVSNNSILNPQTFTLGAWVYIRSYPTSFPRVFSKETGIIADPYALEIDNSSNRTTFCVKNDTNDEMCAYSSTNSITKNVWHYVTGTYNGTHLTAYADGTSGTPVSLTYTIPQLATYLFFGNNNPSNNRRLNGTIDEARIWNRSLSQTEINAEMQSSLPVTRPIASWSFEELDTANYTNDTHIWVKGFYGSALSFDGNGDVVNAAYIPNSSITAMAWIYPKQILGDERAIVGKWGSSSEWYLRLSNATTAQLELYIINITGGWEEADSTNANIQKNNLYHVAVTYNRDTGQVYFYKNGTQLTTNRQIGKARNGLDVIRIGAQGGGTYDYFNGTIDEVKIFNKVLTQADIQTEMNKG